MNSKNNILPGLDADNKKSALKNPLSKLTTPNSINF